VCSSDLSADIARTFAPHDMLAALNLTTKDDLYHQDEQRPTGHDIAATKVLDGVSLRRRS
ncbi:MAG: hypothetical protein ACKPKO_48790, partial [Candidatus Fonsibacter sp.]